MAKTTVEKLKLTAKGLANLSVDALQLFIDDAFMQVKEAGFPDEWQDVANRYLAAHLAVLDEKNVKSEGVGPLKREYSDKDLSFLDLNSTAYGQEYARLLKLYGDGRKGLSMVVV
ncbi:DUF4054 domain-containing protein [Listeria fleischmannii]|uniref:DUF4054 domain-containing protein n=1 Tax=Listeria fleischmannii FSL S10-1203 TaxID=1265822 RepID=W7D4B8_9LIST|nr:DUF4054 domain-containing protein [Listeria fleischmannii]EUJ44047.1 hypothetical protein MCOL2_20171 [Listeria fleischmannii FSL S10-1203]